MEGMNEWEQGQKAFDGRLVTMKDTKHEWKDTKTCNTKAQKCKNLAGDDNEWHTTTNNPDDLKTVWFVLPVSLLQACVVWRENLEEDKEHNQTPQTFTETRLFVEKGNLRRGDMGLQNECLLQNTSLSSLGFYILYFQERRDWNDQVYICIKPLQLLKGQII